MFREDEVQDEIAKLTLNDGKQDDVNDENSDKKGKRGKKKKDLDWCIYI